MTRPIAVLTIVAVVSGAVLGITDQVLEPYIEAQRLEVFDAAIEELFGPPERKDVEFVHEDDDVTILRVARDGELLGYAVEAAGSGYNAPIEVMVSFSPDRSEITGMVVLGHDETPGIGDFIEKEDFRKQFVGMPVSVTIQDSDDPGESEVEAVSGATATVRGALRAVNRAMDALVEHVGEA